MSGFTALLTRDGSTVAALAGRPAERLARGIATAADEAARQLLLARATGNYKRGGER